MNKIIIQTLLLHTKVCPYYHPAGLLQSSVVPYTLIQWVSCLQTDMTYLITRINRIQDALQVTQLLHTNYFINHDLL